MRDILCSFLGETRLLLLQFQFELVEIVRIEFDRLPAEDASADRKCLRISFYTCQLYIYLWVLCFRFIKFKERSAR